MVGDLRNDTLNSTWSDLATQTPPLSLQLYLNNKPILGHGRINSPSENKAVKKTWAESSILLSLLWVFFVLLCNTVMQLST